MKTCLVSLAGGVCALALSGLVAMGQPGAAQPGAAPGQPRFINARVETRAAGAPFTQAFAALVQGQQAPGWIGYSVPAIPGDQHLCDSDRPQRVYLEGRRRLDRADTQAEPSKAPRDIAVLLRVEGGHLQKARVTSMDCEVEAGGLPVTWLTGVRGADSVAMLLDRVTHPDPAASAPRLESLVMAIALHADATAQQALETLASPSQPLATRKRAAFWLGAARGEDGFRILKRLASAERDDEFRRELVFPISLGRLPEATEVLIQLAKSDSSAAVRKQAMFWLGQKAGSAAVSTLGDAASNDPDTEVKKRAVFGLSRMANGEGVPRLIEVARTNANPEVRRQAMFWLGQSNDPRALAFLEEILKK